MMTQCQQLLQEPDLEQAVRVGDVYGLMIEWVCVGGGVGCRLAAASR